MIDGYRIFFPEEMVWLSTVSPRVVTCNQFFTSGGTGGSLASGGADFKCVGVEISRILTPEPYLVTWMEIERGCRLLNAWHPICMNAVDDYGIQIIPVKDGQPSYKDVLWLVDIMDEVLQKDRDNERA